MAYTMLYDEKLRPIFPTQHPDADLDYGISFQSRLSGYGDGDTIASAVVDSERGVTLHDDAFDDYVVVFWAKEGGADNQYIVTVTITTTLGRVIPYELVIPFGHDQVELESYS